MKSSAVYLKAAQMVKTGEWVCCSAIGYAAADARLNDWKLVTDFSTIFSPRGEAPSVRWSDLDYGSPEYSVEAMESNNHRVLMLCLAAAISSSEGD